MTQRDLPLVAVLGGGGEIGRALQARGARNLVVRNVGRRDVDLRDPQSVTRFVADHRPDLVINLAAYTDVDAAESDQGTAIAINALAVEALAGALEAFGGALLHLSTAWVFDGGTDNPYLETDHAAPLNTYGATRLLGEQLAQLALPRVAIVRTSSLISAHGRNVVARVLDADRSGARVALAADIVSSPTDVDDLARVLLAMAPQLIRSDAYADCWGVTHCAGMGHCSEADLGETALSLWGAEPSTVMRQFSADWPLVAARPRWTVLDCSRLTRTFGLQMRPWREATGAIVRARQTALAPEVA